MRYDAIVGNEAYWKTNLYAVRMDGFVHKWENEKLWAKASQVNYIYIDIYR